jgi:hypothetical protein
MRSALAATSLAWAGLALPMLACGPPSQRPIVLFPAAQAHAQGDRPLTTLQPFADVKPEDAIVSVVAGEVSCSGTLIAEDLVLTAHHCISERDARGRATSRDRAPDEVSVQLGDGDLPWAEVDVRVIVAPPCGYHSGPGDLAILVLARKLVGIPAISPRFEAPPRLGESITPFGFGRCAHTSSPEIRVQRGGGAISHTSAWEFIAPASICPGDSGGPALARWTERRGDASIVASELVGVVSASAMDDDDRTEGTSVFTRIDAWRSLFATAQAVAAGASPSELPPSNCE